VVFFQLSWKCQLISEAHFGFYISTVIVPREIVLPLSVYTHLLKSSYKVKMPVLSFYSKKKLSEG